MLKHNIHTYTHSIIGTKPYIGESIETKVLRITQNKEPISDGSPTIYMERKDGIKPEYDIRTDRWEIALDAMDIVSKTKLAKRIERHTPKPDLSGKPQGTEPETNPAA